MMIKLLLVLFAATCAMSTATAGFQAEETEVANYCTVGTCSACSIASEKKSCNDCVLSIKSLVAGTTDVFECTKKNSISDCAKYIDVAHVTTSGCSLCKRKYPKAGTAVNGKTPYTCETLESPTENCTHYALNPLNNNAAVCTLCEKTHYLDPTNYTCVELGSVTTIENCSAHYMISGALKCFFCKDKFALKGEACVAQTTAQKGCANLNDVGTLCERCEFNHGYYAVDYDATIGNTCKYESVMIKTMAFVSAIFIGSILL